MQRLSPAERRRHRLVRHANDVVHRLLRRERDTRGLRVKAHHQRARVLRAVPIPHVARPDAPGGTELRYLLEEIVVDVPEEGETWGKRIDIETARDPAFDIREAVSESERELLSRRCACFSDVVAGDRYRVPLRNVLRRPLEAIDDQS